VTTTNELALDEVGLTPNVLVLIDHAGACLAAARDRADHRLSLEDLEQLLVLASGRPWSAPDTTALGALADRGLLRSGRSRQANRADRTELAKVSTSGDDGYDGTFVLITPTALRVAEGGFELLDHEGRVLVRLDPVEVVAATAFCAVVSANDGHLKQTIILGGRALDRATFDALRGRLETVGLLGRAGSDGEDTQEGKLIRDFRRGLRQSMQRADLVDRWLADHQKPVDRIRVVPVTNGDVPLLSLGLIMAYAAVYDDGRLSRSFDFVGDWMNRTIPSLDGTEPPAVFAFSNYLWSHQWNLGASADAKAKNATNVTVHGGPDTPKYPSDVEDYFAANAHVDVTVHGEGEVTFAELLDALQPSLAAGTPDLRALDRVAGLSYRDGDRVVHTADRDRIADLDIVPSPFTNGMFDSVGDIGLPYLIIETNRGCPYGCTYCDWGSATLSRIRKFDLDRVFEDLEWAARNKVEVIWNADANFGVFARDVEIARKVVELKREYGYPRLLGANYAKNTVKHLKQIVDTLVEGGILATGVLSMQSADPETLLTIRRSNINVNRYDDLADEFSRNELPLVTELMMGLPGSTLRSFSDDLQQCIDREMRARVYPTELLVNSPMNEPEYRKEHRIETIHAIKETWTLTDTGGRTAPFVVATASFSRDDYQQMDRFRQHFFLFENYGVLRQVARYVRQETGVREMDLYRRMEDDVALDRERWPILSFTFDSLRSQLIPPLSWRLFIDEVGDYLTEALGIEDSPALQTVLAVQHALLPARDRSFPTLVELAHDFAAWHQRMIALKLGGHSEDWVEFAPRLSEYGPSTFEVTDPQAISTEGLGAPLLSSNEADWELRSPVGRTLTFLRTA